VISRRQALLLAALLAASPIFGVYLADLVGYREPLDVAAELLELKEVEVGWAPFPDYTVPGLPVWLGYIVSGAIGVAAILLVGYALAKLSSGRGGEAGRHERRKDPERALRRLREHRQG